VREFGILKLKKTPLIDSVSNSIWTDLELCLGGDKSTKAPVETGVIYENILDCKMLVISSRVT